ncbi:MAG: hypothetical protein HKN56_10740 [Gammaproteobacteria bacterium]|nr:hypothetical protein [Gammaproteobacteria bacterium]
MTAIIVFLLMVIGSILSVREFERLIDESSDRESRRAQAEHMHHDNFRHE